MMLRHLTTILPGNWFVASCGCDGLLRRIVPSSTTSKKLPSHILGLRTWRSASAMSLKVLKLARVPWWIAHSALKIRWTCRPNVSKRMECMTVKLGSNSPLQESVENRPIPHDCPWYPMMFLNIVSWFKWVRLKKTYTYIITCVYIYIYIWMDGWMESWIHGWMDQSSHSNCPRLGSASPGSLGSCGFWSPVWT